MSWPCKSKAFLVSKQIYQAVIYSTKYDQCSLRGAHFG